MAQEAGLAARRLSACGLPGAEAVAELLSEPRNCACSGTEDGPACGLAEMTALLDAPPGETLELKDTASPLLLLSFALAHGDGCWWVSWPGGSALGSAEGLELSGDLPQRVAPVTLQPAAGRGTFRAPECGSREVNPDAWRVLEDLAKKLLVPETAHSRKTGAGPS
jgi:hypothetical protein